MQRLHFDLGSTASVASWVGVLCQVLERFIASADRGFGRFWGGEGFDRVWAGGQVQPGLIQRAFGGISQPIDK